MCLGPNYPQFQTFKQFYKHHDVRANILMLGCRLLYSLISLFVIFLLLRVERY